MKKSLFVAVFFLASCASLSPAQRTMINGVELDYVVQGSGPPLYLLHGGMESRNSFDEQIADFSKHFTIVALDSRKQGRSVAPDAPISYELMSQDVQALAEHLGHQRISIMGLSDGGITALVTAVDRPEFVDRLVLLGATFHYNAYPEDVREFISTYEWDGNTDADRYPGNFIQHYMVGHENLSGFGALLSEMAVMWTTSPALDRDDLARITSKTLVINGDHEDVPLAHTFELYDSLCDAQLFVVPNATHYALDEKPDLLNETILHFLLSDQ